MSLVAGSVLAADAPASTEPDTSPVDIEVFKAPELIPRNTGLLYPEKERREGSEGWVQLNFMVDPAGKPYEPTIVASSGNPAFEKEALRSVDTVRFKPAMRGKAAISASQDIKVYFRLNITGARREFIDRYRAIAEAVERGDKAAADERFDKLDAKNLYEDAYSHLARHNYYLRWGTEAQQLAQLQQAVAYENSPNYLKRGEFVSVVGGELRLEIKLHEYGTALRTWEKLKPYMKKEDLKSWQGLIDQLEALRKSDATVLTRESIERGSSWHGHLFKARFEVVVAEGHVSEIKLRCEKQYLFFRYDPGVQYRVDSKGGRCSIEVIGDEGTHFDLIQS